MVMSLMLGCSAIDVVATAIGAGEAAKPAAPPSEKLASLAWIAGSWRADFDGDQLDEVWTTPSANSMFGAFRWMKGGKAWMFEMLTIMDDGTDVVMRIKHFDDKGVGWEEKGDAVTMKLVKQVTDLAQFERIGSDQAAKITYQRSGADTLLLRLETSHQGKPDMKEFQFKRAAL